MCNWEQNFYNSLENFDLKNLEIFLNPPTFQNCKKIGTIRLGALKIEVNL